MLDEILARCIQGGLSPSLTAMHLLMQARTPAEATGAIEKALAEREPQDDESAERLRAALGMLRDNPQAWDAIRSILREVPHDTALGTADDVIARLRQGFDRAARISPEASVALYCLGDPTLLRAATDEIARRMDEWGLLGRSRTLFEIGCGIGRFQEVLASRLGLAMGADISGALLASARRRCAACPSVAFVQSLGRNLAFLADRAIDIVLAVDTFPYLVQAGLPLAACHVREAARVLKPGGDLLILNFSYRRNLEQDRRDMAAMARGAGLSIVRNGTRDLTTWDGVTFHLVKRG